MGKTEMSMYDYIKQGCIDRNEEKIFYYNNAIKAGKLLDTVDAVASYLVAEGVNVGDSVGICLPNIPQSIFALYAINKIGAVANIIHPKIHANGLVKILNSTRTRIVFLFDQIMDSYEKEVRESGVKIISCSVNEYMKGIVKAASGLVYSKKCPNAVKFSEIARTQVAEISTATDCYAPAVYLHSSGTSGQPKTVVLSSYAVNSLAENVAASVQRNDFVIYSHETMLMILPLFHGFGLGICVHLPLRFLRIVLMPRFSAKEAVALIKKHKIAYLPGIPMMFERILHEPSAQKGNKLASLRQLYCGSDFLSAELRESFDTLLKENGAEGRLLEGYGLSEVASVLTVNVNGSYKAGSQGLATQNSSIMILREDGSRCAPDEKGRVYIRSQSMMLGYLDDGDNAGAFFTDESGKKWLNTGDIGRLDAEGYFTFCEREKRMIKIAGVNIFPSEIENAVRELREVDEVCAVRASDGGVPFTKLYVVINKSFRYSEPIKHRIESVIRESCMKYAVPKEIIPVDELKRNLMGKVDYKLYEAEELK